MEGDGKNLRATRRNAKITLPEIPAYVFEADDLEESPRSGVVDVVQEAILSLGRAQAEAQKRASDIAELLLRKKMTVVR